MSGTKVERRPKLKITPKDDQGFVAKETRQGTLPGFMKAYGGDETS